MEPFGLIAVVPQTAVAVPGCAHLFFLLQPLLGLLYLLLQGNCLFLHLQTRPCKQIKRSAAVQARQQHSINTSSC